MNKSGWWVKQGKALSAAGGCQCRCFILPLSHPLFFFFFQISPHKKHIQPSTHQHIQQQ